MKNQFLYVLGALFLINFTFYAQCSLQETVTVCDMTKIDRNNDGTPDGIINLYEAYSEATGNTIQQGKWFDPGFNFALDEDTGDLFLFDLDSSSESVSDYQFQLTNASCGDEIALTINLILGPFSGIAVPAFGPNEVNVEICDMGIDPCGSSTFFDLNQTLLSIPSAHDNGVWSYEGDSPNFIGIILNSIFLADVPYQPGVPLVDEETFELVYTVPGITPCAPSVATRVKVSVIREVFAGAANELNICETELMAGDFDDIDLRDDDYLVNEDVEGIWLADLDPTGQISGPGDSKINLGEVYDQLYASNQRFGCRTYEYSYFVDSRSAVCSDKTSTVRFNFFEYLRPFQQDVEPPEFCVEEPANGTFDLYSLITFTTENDVLYDYPNNTCTNWTLVSGPSNLGLISNSGDLCSTIEDPNYTSRGTINLTNLTNADAGTYTFRFYVDPEYNCVTAVPIPEIIYEQPFGCSSSIDLSNACDAEFTDVTIIINPINYPGEDTANLEFCETNFTVPTDLITLLDTNGIDDPVYEGNLGAWVDSNTNQAITNPYTLPEIIGQQTFNFTYNTTTDKDCEASADLSFTVFEDYSPGSDASVNICSGSDPLELFEELGGEPHPTGTWTGPGGFTSEDNSVIFDPLDFEAGDYVYTVPENGPCPSSMATVSVSIITNLAAGSDMLASICRSDSQTDLITLIDPRADAGGVFSDLDNTGALSGSIVDVSGLGAGDYDFEYQVQSDANCPLSTAIITLAIVEVDPPNAADQTFCLIDGPTVADLQVTSGGINVIWYDSSTASVALPGSTLLINNEDYFAAVVDTEGCESDRISIRVTLLQIYDPNCNDCSINDGVSANGDNENDVLELCGLPSVFPDFEIKIFNRYGTIVYRGDNGTEPFNGTSNVSMTLGDELASGIYFYVFDPRDDLVAPFQGNFYLSR